MNTSKQVNAMIGLLFLSFLAFGAYIVNEPNRAASARDTQAETAATRGAALYVNNCRTCHGAEGHGAAEGGVAPELNATHFLVIGAGDRQYEETPEGEVRTVRRFLFDTIACGRTGTAMPPWHEEHGGPLSHTQINYLVELITQGRWDLVAHYGEDHDAPVRAQEAQALAAFGMPYGELDSTQQDAVDNAIRLGQATRYEDLTPEERAAVDEAVNTHIVVADPSTLSVTERNCGQYNLLTARDIYGRQPLVAAPTDGTPGPATPTAEPGNGGTPDAMVQGVPVGDFFLVRCAPCHGRNREGLVGPPLTPNVLTQPDDFYFDTIANGRGAIMPAWRAQGLTDDEIHALVEFIKNVPPR